MMTTSLSVDVGIVVFVEEFVSELDVYSEGEAPELRDHCDEEHEEAETRSPLAPRRHHVPVVPCHAHIYCIHQIIIN